MTKCSFIGLGVMGYPMAGYLSKAGFDVCVFNRTVQKAEQWQAEYGGAIALSPAVAAKDADYVFACVGRDEDVKAVTLSENGALHAMKPGAVFVDHTTTSADLARELGSVFHSHGLGFLDAPVSGGQAGAENGQLTIMVGGEEPVFANTESVMQSYAKSVKLMGGVGAGQLTKMVNQICIAGLLEGLAEGIHFAQQAGLDVSAVIDVISKGAAQSWQMENRFNTMAQGEFDFGFAVDWMRKDLAICLAEAKDNGAHLPVTKIVDQYYGDVQSLGGGRWDTSSLLHRLKNL